MAGRCRRDALSADELTISLSRRHRAPRLNVNDVTTSSDLLAECRDLLRGDRRFDVQLRLMERYPDSVDDIATCSRCQTRARRQPSPASVGDIVASSQAGHAIAREAGGASPVK